MDADVRAELDALRLRVETLEVRIASLGAGNAPGNVVDAPEGWGTAALGGDDAEIVELLRAGNKIEAIKVWRERTGLGLKESMEAVEEIERRL